jgi:hypothetical protein
MSRVRRVSEVEVRIHREQLAAIPGGSYYTFNVTGGVISHGSFENEWWLMVFSLANTLGTAGNIWGTLHERLTHGAS